MREFKIGLVRSERLWMDRSDRARSYREILGGSRAIRELSQARWLRGLARGVKIGCQRLRSGSVADLLFEQGVKFLVSLDDAAFHAGLDHSVAIGN